MDDPKPVRVTREDEAEALKYTQWMRPAEPHQVSECNRAPMSLVRLARAADDYRKACLAQAAARKAVSDAEQALLVAKAQEADEVHLTAVAWQELTRASGGDYYDPETGNIVRAHHGD